MVYKILNLVTGIVEYIETSEKDAQDRLKQIQNEFLIQENYRFTVAKEITNGSDTTWVPANLDNDNEDDVYYVFNTITGQHEKMLSLSEAKMKQEQIKQNFLIECGLDKYEILDSIPTFKKTNKTI
jgi:Icc-related predicted phosphoesterase